MKMGDIIESAGTRYLVVDVAGMGAGGVPLVRLSHPTCGELAEWYPVALLLAAGWRVVAKQGKAENMKSSRRTGYVTIGSVRGACPHVHRTISAAQRCLARDRSGCASQGGYSDRRIVRVDGDSAHDLGEAGGA